VLAIIAAVLTLIVGLILFVFGLIQLVTIQSLTIQPNPIFSSGIVFLSIGVILIPFGLIKTRALSDHKVSPHKLFLLQYPSYLIPILFCSWVLILVIGYSFFEKEVANTLLIPFLAVFAVILPIFIYVLIANKIGCPIDKSRGWGALSVGIIAAPLISNLIEFGLIAVVFLLFIFVLVQNPESVSSLENLVSRLSSAQTNPEIINNLLSSFIRQPVFQYVGLSFVSGIIPIIEEAVKQTPIWLLSWRRLSPREGLMLGALGGAGFALTESLLTVTVIGNPDQWLFQMIGRAGTGLMHMTTGAISGWGLASSFGGRGFLKSLGFYLISIIIHGFWNGLAIWEGFGRLFIDSSIITWQFSGTLLLPGIMLFILFFGMLLFWIFNKKILRD
jgi:hypothetical protein